MTEDHDNTDITIARVAALQEILQNEIRAGNNLSATRLDKLEAVRAEDHTAMQLQLDQRMEAIQLEMDQRLAAIQLQLDQRLASEGISRTTALTTSTAAIKAALDAAEKAVQVANEANEKRFESVNEFRRTLTDQTATFPNRNEVNIRMDGLTQQITRNTEMLSQLELRLTSRLDTLSASGEGGAARKTEARLDFAAILQFLSVVIAIAAILFAVLHH